MDRLLAAVSGRRDEPLSAVTGQVFDARHDREHEDDTYLLVARLGPGQGEPSSG